MKVLYNAVGTTLSACAVDLSCLPALELAPGLGLPPAGFAVDYKTY